jgi:hypothetical protein
MGDIPGGVPADTVMCPTVARRPVGTSANRLVLILNTRAGMHGALGRVYTVLLTGSVYCPVEGL